MRWGVAALAGLVVLLAVLWAGNTLVSTVSAGNAQEQQTAAETALRQAWESAPQEAEPAVDKAWATISIPRIDLADEVVREGVESQQINVGVGHYIGTEFPWQETGNVGLAGHRSGWGEPFNRLDELKVGDQIVIETAKARYTYSVTGTTVVDPKETWVLHDPSAEVTGATDQGQILTLTTCEGADNEERLIVWAQLSEATPKA